MRFRRSLWWALLAVTSLPILASAATRSGAAPAATMPDRATITRSDYSLPLSFESNQGQTDPQVRFLSRGAGSAGFEDLGYHESRSASPYFFTIGPSIRTRPMATSCR
jgi:hypothetical protein